jgi:hypothetical protein
MNVLLRQHFPTNCGLNFPKDFNLAIETGLNFRISSDDMVLEAIEKGPGNWEHDVWLPRIKEGTYRMIIYGLTIQLMRVKQPFYKRWFYKLKNWF